MDVAGIEREGEVLTVRCRGSFGGGSGGLPSARKLQDAVGGFLAAHRGEAISVIEVDFRDVDYVSGDGPVSSLMPFVVQKSVTRVRYLASAENRTALTDLVEYCGHPDFEVT